MTITYPFLPLYELTRGEVKESVHFGAFAVVDSRRKLISNHGNPNVISFLRSSTKPLQALPIIENNGHERWRFSKEEIAVFCASHTGTNRHYDVITHIQEKIQVTEDDLLCGIHPAIDQKTRESMLIQNTQPTPNRHNCSGKHTGMLTLAKLLGAPLENYISINHPIQREILKTFQEMCLIKPKDVTIGIDGCSAPVFAIPLKNAALGYARLCDPWELDPKRADACRIITDAMVNAPIMVSGPGKFDTRLMEVTSGKIISKGGAEGFQQFGIMPNVLGTGSPGLGIAIKISDGDAKGRTRPAVALEILSQLGAISHQEMEALAEFGPRLPVKNWRNLVVGKAYPIFTLEIQ